MRSYLLRRLAGSVMVLWGVATLVFLMVHLIPGDPVVMMLDIHASSERVVQLRDQLGLNDPLLAQYARYMRDLVQLDLGRSLRSNRLVTDELASRAWPTFQLALSGMALAVVLGVIAGAIAAAKRNTWVETVVMSTATVGVTIPSFLLAMLLVMVFSLNLRWLPSMGAGTWRNLVLPSLSLGFLYSALIARVTRTAMLESLAMDYITVARAKGLTQGSILFRHALRNALIPVITIIGIYFGLLLGGTLVIETVFSWPGLGTLAVNSILARDFPVTQGIVLFLALSFSVLNLLVDLTYGLIDPRIRFQ